MLISTQGAVNDDYRDLMGVVHVCWGAYRRLRG